jgi:hypothetical protein
MIIKNDKISAETVLHTAEKVAPLVAEVAVDLAPRKSKKDVRSIAAIILSILAIAGQIFQAVH